MQKFPSVKHYIFASDFDQTLSYNDSGYVLSELLGIYFGSRGRLLGDQRGRSAYFSLLRNHVARKVVRLGRAVDQMDAKYQAVKTRKRMSFFIELALPPELVPAFSQPPVQATPDATLPSHWKVTSKGTSRMATRTIEVGLKRIPGGAFVEGLFSHKDLTFDGTNVTDAYDSRLGTYSSQATHSDASGTYPVSESTRSNASSGSPPNQAHQA